MVCLELHLISNHTLEVASDSYVGFVCMEEWAPNLVFVRDKIYSWLLFGKMYINSELKVGFLFLIFFFFLLIPFL